MKKTKKLARPLAWLIHHHVLGHIHRHKRHIVAHVQRHDEKYLLGLGIISGIGITKIMIVMISVYGLGFGMVYSHQSESITNPHNMTQGTVVYNNPIY